MTTAAQQFLELARRAVVDPAWRFCIVCMDRTYRQPVYYPALQARGWQCPCGNVRDMEKTA